MLRNKLSGKKIVCGILLWMLTLGINPVWATEAPSGADFTILINQQQLTIPADDQQPVIIDGRTYVPLRVISENMGATVDWNGDTRQVAINWKNHADQVLPPCSGTTVQIVIDGQALEIPADMGQAYISDLGRTMIPLRAVGEAMDCEVGWNNDARTVEINYTPPVPSDLADLPSTSDLPTPSDLPDQPKQPDPADIELLQDLAQYRTNLKLMDGKVINSEDLLNSSPEDFSPEQLAAFKTYLSQLSQYTATITLPDGTSVNSADVSILGDSYLTARQLRRWIEDETPRLQAKAEANGWEFQPIPEDLAELYIEIGEEYGVRGDIAFCQAAKETGYWQFTGQVTPEQNNYCGLYATGAALTGQESFNGADPDQVCFEEGLHGATFVTPAAGVEAHIQHLYAYATKKSLPDRKVLIDPRYALVSKGIAPTWLQLNARWAVPGTTYGQSILSDYWLKAAEK